MPEADLAKNPIAGLFAMPVYQRFACLFASFALLGPLRVHADDSLERLTPVNMIGGAPTLINGTAVNLVFDTGAAAPLVLSETCVKRLKLKLAQPIPDTEAAPGHPGVGFTEPCNWEFFGNNIRQSFPVYRIPAASAQSDEDAAVDGLIGWPLMRNEIMDFSLAIGRFSRAEKVPPEVIAQWPHFAISDARDTLSLIVPSDANGIQRIVIDTGDSGGVLLPHDLWLAWKAAHPTAPTTLTMGSMFGDLNRCTEESWDPVFTVGPLDLDNVPVSEAGPGHTQEAAPGEKIIVFGLAALRRIQMFSDGPKHIAYAIGISDPAPPYQHNRVGMVFLPGRDLKANPVARVAPGSPAAEAGIRDGDVLLAVNQAAITDWASYLAVDRKLKRPSGIKIEYTLRRAKEVIHATVVPRDILVPTKSTTPEPETPSATVQPK
jgi:hypothetical protein